MTKFDPLWQQSGSYNGREDRSLIANLWDEGVMDLASFVVTQRAAGANFTVDITAGAAVVQGDIDAFQGNYLCTETAATTGTTITSAPSAGNERYDRVILEVRDNTEDSSGANDWRFRVVAGTPATVVSGTAAPPALPSHAITLAVVGPIQNSTSTITNAIITDGRILAGRRCTPGTIDQLAGAKVPNGWLSCDGSAVSRTTYARLFAHTGITYGAGNGSTTFNLPDLRGKVAVPAKSGQTEVASIGQTGGEYTHTLTTGEMPAHVHTINHDHPATDVMQEFGASRVGFFGGGASGDSVQPSSSPVGVNGFQVDIPAYSGDSGSVGSGTAHNVMQPYQVVGLAVIRT